MQFGSKQFYDYYEAAHQNSINRSIHHLAHSLAIAGTIILVFKPLMGVAVIAVTCCLSWAGHFLFEKNTPAFFETAELSARNSIFHYIKVAVGGVFWTICCFLRLFHLGPLTD